MQMVIFWLSEKLKKIQYLNRLRAQNPKQNGYAIYNN